MYDSVNYLKAFNLIILTGILLLILYIRHLSLLLKNFESLNIPFDKNKYLKDDFLRMCYKSRSFYYKKERNLNESNLVTIQQKINYLTVHESPDFKSKIVDKILLHDFSIKKLGFDICVPIIKIYNNSEEIKLEDLPDKFVLKCNHGSGMNIFCKNKTNFDIENAKLVLNNWKNINYGLKYSEFQYINVDRKIFSEIYLKDEIEDYKIYCFHGFPKFIRVQKHLKGMNWKINNYYDLHWKLTEIESGIPGYLRRPDIIFDKPKNFNLMIEYAKKLSEDFAFVRVDLYNINGKIFLGEMTFTPSNCGFQLKNMEQSIELGKLIYIYINFLSYNI